MSLLYKSKTPVLLLSGDVYFTELSEMRCTSASGRRRLLEFTSSGLTHAWHGPYELRTDMFGPPGGAGVISATGLKNTLNYSYQSPIGCILVLNRCGAGDKHTCRRLEVKKPG